MSFEIKRRMYPKTESRPVLIAQCARPRKCEGSIHWLESTQGRPNISIWVPPVFSGTMGWVFVMMKEVRSIAIGVDSVGGRSAACAL
jgi:hypothetical protein